ncbi:hypothetical protein M5K25_007103 [Dendrobium thyrsiflorum]|uniref:Uncharacterized protein n=1 Tax=Dendrobium thyrsiflorum TaxID=117978 RepID=A0ABD0VDD9_DENTH
MFATDRQTAYTRSSPARWDGKPVRRLQRERDIHKYPLAGKRLRLFQTGTLEDPIHPVVLPSNGTTPMVLPPNGTVGKRLRPGPSEPDGLPSNGTIILRSWSSPDSEADANTAISFAPFATAASNP